MVMVCSESELSLLGRQNFFPTLCCTTFNAHTYKTLYLFGSRITLLKANVKIGGCVVENLLIICFLYDELLPVLLSPSVSSSKDYNY